MHDEKARRKLNFSFVVDQHPSFYFQSELLLHALIENCGVNKSQIIVQCVLGVDNDFISFLNNNNIQHTIIKPYLDGKYCNKIHQLEYFVKHGDPQDDVILIDTDVYFLSLPRISNRAYVAGKIVDGPFPLLSTLKNIYKAAEISLPSIVDPDWFFYGHKTIDNNFNGGFYYIPAKYINQLNTSWKVWAKWLYFRPELFENPQFFIHVDQVSMGLALRDLSIPYVALPANNNFPTHRPDKCRSYSKDQPVSMFHYHGTLTRFGNLNVSSANKKIKAEIIQANETICTLKKSHFYSSWRRAQVKPVLSTKKASRFRSKLRELLPESSPRKRLILHAGTPKTGTTSLQFYFDKNRNYLIRHGVLYPKEVSKSRAPKHQWIVNLLLNGKALRLATKISEVVLSTPKNVDTIFFSTEGLFNHHWDFDPIARSLLQVLPEFFELEVWVFYRNPIAYMESFYIQNLKNHTVPQYPVYGKDISLMASLNDPWFVRHLDYLGFILDWQCLHKNIKVRVFDHNAGSTIDQVCGQLRLPAPYYTPPRLNVRLPANAITELRTLNRLNLPSDEKWRAVQSLIDVYKSSAKAAEPFRATEEERAAIKHLFSFQKKAFAGEFNFLPNWDDSPA